MKLIISEATVEDVELLSENFVAYLAEFKVSINKLDFADFIFQIIENRIVRIKIARLPDNSVIGFSCFTITYSPLTMGKMYHLDDLYVIPSERNKGYASLILDYIEKEAAENGIKKIMLNTDKSRSDSTSLYLKWGYLFTPLTPMYKMINK